MYSIFVSLGLAAAILLLPEPSRAQDAQGPELTPPPPPIIVPETETGDADAPPPRHQYAACVD